MLGIKNGLIYVLKWFLSTKFFEMFFEYKAVKYKKGKIEAPSGVKKIVGVMYEKNILYWLNSRGVN